MGRGTKMLGVAAILVALLSIFIGCGAGNDLLDENGQNYTASLDVQDNDESTLQVDIYQNLDCDGDPTTDDPEDWSDALGEITVTVGANAFGIVLDYYTITYVPLYSVDSNNDNQMSPTLTSPASPGESNFSVATGATGVLPITLITMDTKNVCFNALMTDPALAALLVARYQIIVTMYFIDEYGNDRTLTVSRTVYLSEYDNC